MDLSHARWRKSSHSTDNGGDCVELAATPDTIAIRDSKNPDGPKLSMSRIDFHRLTAALKEL